MRILGNQHAPNNVLKLFFCSDRFPANMQAESPVTSPKFDLLDSCGKFRVLVGVTGSVAALKVPLLVSQLLELPGVSIGI